jgi:hypothetical protein
VVLKPCHPKLYADATNQAVASSLPTATVNSTRPNQPNKPSAMTSHVDRPIHSANSTSQLSGRTPAVRSEQEMSSVVYVSSHLAKSLTTSFQHASTFLSAVVTYKHSTISPTFKESASHVTASRQTKRRRVSSKYFCRNVKGYGGHLSHAILLSTKRCLLACISRSLVSSYHCGT